MFTLKLCLFTYETYLKYILYMSCTYLHVYFLLFNVMMVDHDSNHKMKEKRLFYVFLFFFLLFSFKRIRRNEFFFSSSYWYLIYIKSHWFLLVLTFVQCFNKELSFKRIILMHNCHKNTIFIPSLVISYCLLFTTNEEKKKKKEK